MIHSIKTTLILAAALFLGTGCLEKYPDDALPGREAISTIEDADQAVVGIYASFKSSALHSGYLTLLPDIQADLVYAVDGYSNTYGDIWRWDILASNREIEAVYASLYTIIGQCNYFFESIRKLEASLNDDEVIDKLEALKGEAHFARALAYSELIKCFCKAYEPEEGDEQLGVVLISSFYHPERMIRSSLKASYEFVISDLEEAQELIRLDETNNSPFVTKSAVKALMARTYLYMQEWQKAVDCATEVIDDPYLMLSSVNEKYTSDQTFYQYLWNYDAGTEVIWKVGFTQTSFGGKLGKPFLNYDYVSFKPDYVPSLWALKLYEGTDLRASAFFTTKLTGYAHGLEWPLLTKYYGNRTFIESNILHVNMPKVLRMSEQYLIRAEAYCQLKKYGDGAKDLTTLRSARYKSYGSAVLTEENWLKTISDERVRELYMEGFRLNDLKRWHMGFEREPQLNSVTMGSSKRVEADDPLFVWPIPQHELDAPGSEIQPNESNK